MSTEKTILNVYNLLGARVLQRGKNKIAIDRLSKRAYMMEISGGNRILWSFPETWLLWFQILPLLYHLKEITTIGLANRNDMFSFCIHGGIRLQKHRPMTERIESDKKTMFLFTSLSVATVLKKKLWNCRNEKLN